MRTTPRIAVAAVIFVMATTVPADEPTIAPTNFRSPADELKLFHLPPGFEAQLVASEPDINKPINMAFDAKGRLWVLVYDRIPISGQRGQGPRIRSRSCRTSVPTARPQDRDIRGRIEYPDRRLAV